jgi:transcriptional regulator with XRE-family HTH domain
MSGPRKRDDAFARVFGTNLARCREQLGVSQEELGFRAGLHRTAVGQLERGERVARTDTLVRLCGSLGVGPDALLAGLGWRPTQIAIGELEIQEVDPADL